MATAPNNLPGFVEQTVVVPSRLWSRVEQLADDSAREPSELVAEALRLLVAGGIPTASASVGGLAAESVPNDPQPGSEGNVSAATIELQLTDVLNEPLDSKRLRTQLTKVMRHVDHRDGFIGPHSPAVAELAVNLGSEMGIKGDAHLELELAALLHDLGKLRIPETILGKQGRLTADEWSTVKGYPEFGAEILRPFENFAGVRAIVGAHQERWDGSGYPKRVAGDDIPLAAQIVGICDVYMVLTSERSYRPALAPDTARRTIESGSDRLWNPKLVSKLLGQVSRR